MSAVADTARIHVASSAAIVGANIPPRLATEANIGDRNTQIDPATKPVNKNHVSFVARNLTATKILIK